MSFGQICQVDRCLPLRYAECLLRGSTSLCCILNLVNGRLSDMDRLKARQIIQSCERVLSLRGLLVLFMELLLGFCDLFDVFLSNCVSINMMICAQSS